MFLKFSLRTQAALFHAGRRAILLAGVEHIAEGLRILREDKIDGFFTLVFVAIDRYGLVDGAGGLQFQLQIIQKCHDTSRASLPGFRIAGAAGGVKEEGEDMSEEQKKKIDGVLHEMKHMNPQQIEVMITYMQGMATAAKLMQAERKEA